MRKNAFGEAVREGPCPVHTSDLRIYVEAAGLATFPDQYDTRDKVEHCRSVPLARESEDPRASFVLRRGATTH